MVIGTMQKIIERIIGSLPIWAGVIVIILSFILWNAQRNDENGDLRAIISLQTKHIAEIIFHEFEDGRGNDAHLSQALSREYLKGFAMELTDGNQVLYRHGDSPTESNAFRKKWSESMSLDLPQVQLNLTVWPEAAYFKQRYSSLPFVAFMMGIVMGVLLITVGFLAHLASYRAQAIIAANKRVREQIREKEKLQQVLQHNQKLQAIGTLAGGIAHDFNNILYAIMGYVAMAREDVPKDSLVYGNLGKVLKAGERGKKLVSSILSFSRRQRPHEMKKVDLVMVLNHVFDLLHPGLPEKILLKKEVNLPQAYVWGDVSSLEQVLINVANNAVDAMNQQGELVIGLDADTAAQTFCLTVKDTGSGMTDEIKQRIFEPFFTTKAVDKGTGLGLSMAHGIIEEHQGRIDVESQLGIGTTFTIVLPMAKSL
jgi:signal transduction histidine kinase